MMKHPCNENSNTYEPNSHHRCSIRPLKINFVWMKNNRMLVVFLFLSALTLRCGHETITWKKQLKNNITEQKINREKPELRFSEKTTSNLCLVANYLKSQNFSGDFYLYDRKIKWCFGVDSVKVPVGIIDILMEEDVEYVACAQGVFEFGFNFGNFDKGTGEKSLLLSSEPNNPLITSGNVRAEYIKLPNDNCLNLNWYLEIFCADPAR